MVIGIGCDLVAHSITEVLDWKTDEEIRHRIFSSRELDLYDKHPSTKFLAGRFAAKEAVLKCLGSGMYDGISMQDIQILRYDSGKPMLEIGGEPKNISDKLGINIWHVTITHSEGYSFAMVIAETQ